MREPQRGGLDAVARRHGARRTAGFCETVRMFFSRPALVLAALGSGATQFITYGLGNFTTLFLMREKGMTLDEVASGTRWSSAIGMGGGHASSPGG